jgi:hypothetical protein
MGGMHACMRAMRQREPRGPQDMSEAAAAADLPIDFGGKLSTATHTLATVVDWEERAYGCTVRRAAWGG